MDYGFQHYTVVLLGCRDGDGNVYVIDEHARRQRLPEAHSREIIEMLRRHGLSVRSLKGFYAGTDIFSTESNGDTVAVKYARLGITLIPANTDRVAGWASLLDRFGDAEAKIAPRLFIHERCRRLIETLPLLQHDPTHPEDVKKLDCDEDGEGGDDAADCLRYLVHTKLPRMAPGRLRGL